MRSHWLGRERTRAVASQMSAQTRLIATQARSVCDVGLDEIGVRARRAGLDAGQAGVDRGGELRRPDRNSRPGGVQHLEGVGVSHGLMKSSADAYDNNPSR